MTLKVAVVGDGKFMEKSDMPAGPVAILSGTEKDIRDISGFMFEPVRLASVTARPLDDWHEDFGDVVWWKFPVEEPGWIGRPDDSGWPGYHTHWTIHPPIPEIVK